MQEYLEANNGEISIAEKQFIFQCRSRMLELKCNMKKDNQDLTCSACGIEDETQMHLLLCESLKQNSSDEAHEITYTDLFSDDITKIKGVGNTLKSKMKQMFKSYKVKRVPESKKQTRTQRKQTTLKTKPKIRNKTKT